MMTGRLAFAIGLFCALIGTQAPEFVQQYRQRLAGAIDELTRVVAAFDDEAASQSLAPHQAIARLEANSDPLVRARGADMDDDIGRLDRLKASLAAMRNAAPLQRVALLARNFDSSTALQTWRDFEPAIPTSAEAAAVGALAFCAGWGATQLCGWPIRNHLRRRRERRRQELVDA
jgi:hypothetical protein